MDMLKVNGLTKRYANGDGVENLHFTVRSGEVVALLGPNGAGKTTTMRCITGLYRPDQGEILIDKHPPGSVEALRMTAFIPDQSFLYPILTVAEHIQFRARAFHVPKSQLKEKVLSALQEVNLLQLADRMSGQLSRGQKQRVILAGAVVQDASLYIFDEPTIGLDIPAKMWLSKWITSKAAEHRTILVSTHSLEFVLETAHRVLLIRDGCLVKEMTVPKNQEQWPPWKEEVILALGEWAENE